MPYADIGVLILGVTAVLQLVSIAASARHIVSDLHFIKTEIAALRARYAPE
ncbi:MAG: hypothetical protein ABSA66_19675 [Roseiarcus sp.]|jgi:hypothetical protein